MVALIHVLGLSGASAAHPAMTASKAVLKRISNGFLRIALARLLEIWKEARGMIPRISGSTQNSSGSSAESAMGNRPAE
ncbi:hypothetical protein D3C86_2115930 [compost metagenome]